MTDPHRNMRHGIALVYVLAWALLLAAILAGCFTVPPIDLSPEPPEATIEDVSGGYLSCPLCEPSLRLEVQVGGDFEGLTLRPGVPANPAQHQLPEDAVAASGPWFTEPKVVYTFHNVEPTGPAVRIELRDGPDVIDTYTYRSRINE